MSNADQMKKADEFCKENFGLTVTDLGWEYAIECCIKDGKDVVEECRRLADKYDLDYINDWMHQ